jgi:hypothetical protein
MQVSVVNFTKDSVVYNFTHCSREELMNKLNLFFTSEGYKQGTIEGDTTYYTKGNRVLRLLFGAFVKYHKQSLNVKQEGDLFSVMLHKDSSGISGGLIGINQVKKEFARLAEAFRAYFT